jgi:aminomethyltransferase
MTPSRDQLAEQYRVIRHECALVEHINTAVLQVSGSGATGFLSQVCSRSVEFLLEGQILPALLINENGDLVAEVLVHCEGSSFRIEVAHDRAAAAGDRLRATAEASPQVTVEDLGDIKVIALEGPGSPAIAQKFLSLSVASMAYPSFVTETWHDHPLLISRTGVSGEYGFKFHARMGVADELAETLVAEGAHPVSQEALDICRLEMRFPNLTQEAPEESATPFTVGLQWMVDFGHDFPGRTALLNRVQNDQPDALVCWQTEADTDVPAPGTPLLAEGTAIGKVRHALYSPGLERVIGVADLDAELAASGLDLALGALGEPATPIRTISSPFRVATSLGLRLE